MSDLIQGIKQLGDTRQGEWHSRTGIACAEKTHDFWDIRQFDSTSIDDFQEETMPGLRLEILRKMGNSFVVEKGKSLILEFFPSLT